MRRNRLGYFIAGCVVVALGLCSRRYAGFLPDLLARYSGDTLYAAMVFIGIGFLVPKWKSMSVAAISLLVCYGIEASQLYHAPWIDDLRRTRLGGLILGFGFLWSDLVCYAVGVMLALLLELALRKMIARRERFRSVA